MKLEEPKSNGATCSPRIDPPNLTQAPASGRKSRRNGKIARLPRKLRDLVNTLLSDGLTYAQIVQRLNESTDPPLPYEIFEKNISTWHDGGYQDWLRHQDSLEILATRLDFARDLAQNNEPEKIQELSLQLAAIRMCEFLSQLAIADPQTDPTIYLRLLSALPRITREALNLQKYRDAATKSTPPPADPQMSDEDRAELSRTAILDKFDDLLGLKSYRHDSPWPSPSPTETAPVAPAANELNVTASSDASAPSASPDAAPPATADTTSSPEEAPPLPPPADTSGHLPTPNSSPPPALTGNCLACGASLPPLLPTGERPSQHCLHCGAPLPSPGSHV